MAATAATVCLGVALGAACEIHSARADQNDALFNALRELCIDATGNVDAVATRALKMPYQSFNYGKDTDRRYVREIGLRKIGTVVMLAAPSRKAPVEECRFVSYSDEMADLASRLRTAFDLPEPTQRSIDDWYVTRGEKITAAKPMKVMLEYGLQDNKRAGAFTLTVSR